MSNRTIQDSREELQQSLIEILSENSLNSKYITIKVNFKEDRFIIFEL